MTADPRDFLRMVSGYARRELEPAIPGSARLATVDPAYSRGTYPGTLPRVTFDGESTLSVKRYPVVGPYWPGPNDRVLLIPIGRTYAILGSVDQLASVMVGGQVLTPGTAMRPVTAEDATALSGISAAYPGTPGSPVVAQVFTAPPSGMVHATVRGVVRSGTNGAGTNLSYEVREGNVIGSGTVVYAVSQYRGIAAGRAVVTSGPAEAVGGNRTLLGGFTAGAQYNIRAMHWVTSGSGGSVDFRAIEVEAVL